MTYLAITGASFVLGFFFTLLTRIMAVKLNILDHPSPPLKNHDRPVPLLGGVSLCLSFIIPVVGIKILLGRDIRGLAALLLGATLMMILGLAGEIRRLSALLRLICQMTIGLLMTFLGVRLLFLDHGLANTVITIIWITGMTNALNIIDIMDGLATGVAGTAAAAFFIVGLLDGKADIMLPAAALFGSSGAFLLFNWRPAKIYLGDEGSYLLGFLLAWLALSGSQPRNNPLAVLHPLLILGVPLLDTALAVALRIKKGLNPIRGSNDHLAQRLVMMGLGKTTAVLTLILLSGCFSALAVASLRLPFGPTLVLDLCLGAAVLAALRKIGKVNMEGYAQVACRIK
jgi:UDP-GlcNAc:undecaprenyl-phosphate GlcNAc-1-phosphate transferase